MDLGGGIKWKEENRGAINSFVVSPDVERTGDTRVPHTQVLARTAGAASL